MPGRLKRKVEKPLLNSESWQQQWAGWQLCGWKIVSTWKVFPDRLEGTAPRNNVWRQNPWTDWNLITGDFILEKLDQNGQHFPCHSPPEAVNSSSTRPDCALQGATACRGHWAMLRGQISIDWIFDDFCWLVPWLLRPWHFPWGPKIIYLHLLSSLLNLFSPMKSHVFAKVVDIYI